MSLISALVQELLKFFGIGLTLDWAFANLNSRGGGQNAPPPNLVISSQMTIKLSGDIIWEKFFEFDKRF